MKPVLYSVMLAGATLGLGGCTMLGGYGGLDVGYNDGYYDSGYGDPYYGDSYYGNSYYGWYDGYYYPGTGYYLYDRAGSRHRWNDRHRRYWEARRGNRQGRENWSNYRRDGDRDGRWDGRRDGDRDGRWDGRRDGTRDGRWDGRRDGNRDGRWDGRRDGDRNDGRQDWRRGRSGDQTRGTSQGQGQGQGWRGRGRSDQGTAAATPRGPVARPPRNRSEQVAAPPQQYRQPQRVERQSSSPAPVRQQIQRAEPANPNIRDD